MFTFVQRVILFGKQVLNLYQEISKNGSTHIILQGLNY
jgi:hypothetical protein